MAACPPVPAFTGGQAARGTQRDKQPWPGAKQPARRPVAWAYYFSLGSAPRRHSFSFAVARHDYSADLHVLDGTDTFEEDVAPPLAAFPSLRLATAEVASP